MLLTAVLTCHICTATQQADRTNILFILADDLGYGDLSSYPNPRDAAGLERLQTPNLDSMAKEGMRFTDAYAGYSVCAPSRHTLMTGIHVGHLQNTDSLVTNSTTIATLLSEQGYDTALIGKWGLDGNYKIPKPPSAGFPTMHGFQYFLGQSDQWQCHNYYPAFQFHNDANVTIEQNINASVKNCGSSDHEKCIWSGDLWTTAAVDYIRNHSTTEKPFFLYLAYTTPHAGSVGSVEENDVPIPMVSKGSYANESWPQVEKDFATAITTLDKRVGMVMDTVKQEGLDKRTVVFFSSDNGAHQEGGHQYQFFNSSGYLNGYKRSIHDGGHRAPLLVRWPGVVAAGSTSTQQWCFYDFFQTAADIAGVSEADLPLNLDGYSLLPTLRGGDGAQPQPRFIYHEFPNPIDPVFKQYPGLVHSFGQNVRFGNWSGVCVGNERPCTGEAPGRFFLYNMSHDQGQLEDVSAEFPNVSKDILLIMKEQYNKTKQ